MFLKKNQKLLPIIITFFFFLLANPAIANNAIIKLQNGEERTRRYTITNFTSNQNGFILEVNWDNGVESTYYLGRSNDLRVDDGKKGLWMYDQSYDEGRGALVLNVIDVGTFILEMESETFNYFYYWHDPPDDCRHALTGRKTPTAEGSCPPF